MKLTKKIKVNVLHFGDREVYEKYASMCPVCGQNIMDEQRTVMGDYQAGDYNWLYKFTARKIRFKCPSCGCQWETKTFRGVKPYAKS